MQIELAPKNPYGLALSSPVMTAAGCFGYGLEYSRMVPFKHIGAIVTRSTTLHGRRVARPPRLAETPAGVLLIGSWPDPGIGRIIERYAPVWASWNTPVIVSIAGATAEEFAAAAGALEAVEGIAGLELNLADHAERAARITAAARAACQLPLLAKLPLGAGLAALARSLTDAGADALTLCAPPHGRAVDPETGEQLEGNLAGPAIRPLVLAALADLAAVVQLPLVGCGGVATTADASALLRAGALAVQVGSALLTDPGAVARIGGELTVDDG